MCNQPLPFLSEESQEGWFGELGQSTSLPLACLERDCRMGLDPLIDECAVCRKQAQDEEALHCVSDDEVKIR